jgi:hypothetical protein
MAERELDKTEEGPYVVFFDEREAVLVKDLSSYLGDRGRTAVFGPLESIVGDHEGNLRLAFRSKELQALLADESTPAPGPNGELCFESLGGAGWRVGCSGECVIFRNWIVVLALAGVSVAHLNSFPGAKP